MVTNNGIQAVALDVVGIAAILVALWVLAGPWSLLGGGIAICLGNSWINPGGK